MEKHSNVDNIDHIDNIDHEDLVEQAVDINKYKDPTFGIEFEYDFMMLDNISSGHPNIRITDKDDYPYPPYPSRHIAGWISHTDNTVGAEVATPVLSTARQYIKAVKKQWKAWFRENDEEISEDRKWCPYFKGHAESKSIGSHIHIGLDDRRLEFKEKKQIGAVTKWIIPLLIAIGANDERRGYVSYRAHGSHYAEKMKKPEKLGGSHYKGISDNNIGTVEYRAFDANMPQVTLTNALMLKEVARQAHFNDIGVLDKYNSYLKYYDVAVESGLTDKLVSRYLRRLLVLSNFRVDTLPRSVQEILYIVFKRQKRPATYVNTIESRLNNRDWFNLHHDLVVNPESFTKILLRYAHNRKVKNMLKHIQMASAKYDILSDYLESDKYSSRIDDELVEISYSAMSSSSTVLHKYFDDSDVSTTMKYVDMLTDDPTVETMHKIEKDIGDKHLVDSLWNLISSFDPMEYQKRYDSEKEKVLEYINNNEYDIQRINGVQKYDSGTIADIIKNYCNECFRMYDYNRNEVIDAKERFYMFTVKDVIIGFGACKVFHGNLMNLYVRKPFRGHGVGSYILRFILNEAVSISDPESFDRFEAIVKDVNIPMNRLLSSFGFVEAPLESSLYNRYILDRSRVEEITRERINEQMDEQMDEQINEQISDDDTGGDNGDDGDSESLYITSDTYDMSETDTNTEIDV